MIDYLITGASGYTGRRLVRYLAAQGRGMRLLLRPTSDTAWLADIEAQVQVVIGDLDELDSVRDALAGMRRLIHLAHIRFAATIAAGLGPATERVVFVSSLRALSAVACPSVAQVAAGEAVARDLAGAIILRPSMIYGPGDDRNLSRLAGWLRRHRWLPVVGRGHLHQPVHVDDVVQVIAHAAANATTGTFAIAGPTPMPYAELVKHVGATIGVRPRLLPLPAAPLLIALRAGLALGLPLPVSVAQIRRLLEDKSYDIGPARQQLAFEPRALPAGLLTSLTGKTTESAT